MGYKLLHRPTPYEEKFIEMLPNEKHRELSRITISIAQEYGFVRRANLDNFDKKYTRYDVTKTLTHLKECGIIKEGYISKYPKGTLKGYKPVHRSRQVAVLFIDSKGARYEESSEVDRYFFQQSGESMEEYLIPSIKELKHNEEDILEGIY